MQYRPEVKGTVLTVLFGYSFTRLENRASRSLLVCLAALISVTETELLTASFLQRVARLERRCA